MRFKYTEVLQIFKYGGMFYTDDKITFTESRFEERIFRSFEVFYCSDLLIVNDGTGISQNCKSKDNCLISLNYNQQNTYRVKHFFDIYAFIPD